MKHWSKTLVSRGLSNKPLLLNELKKTRGFARHSFFWTPWFFVAPKATPHRCSRRPVSEAGRRRKKGKAKGAKHAKQQTEMQMVRATQGGKWGGKRKRVWGGRRTWGFFVEFFFVFHIGGVLCVVFFCRLLRAFWGLAQKVSSKKHGENHCFCGPRNPSTWAVARPVCLRFWRSCGVNWGWATAGSQKDHGGSPLRGGKAFAGEVSEAFWEGQTPWVFPRIASCG